MHNTQIDATINSIEINNMGLEDKIVIRKWLLSGDKESASERVKTESFHEFWEEYAKDLPKPTLVEDILQRTKENMAKEYNRLKIQSGVEVVASDFDMLDEYLIMRIKIAIGELYTVRIK